MPAASRKGDLSTGHEGWPPSACVDSATSKTFINGILAQKKTSAFATHCKGKVCHPQSNRKSSTGSSTVFIENQPAIRIGDDIGCGDSVSQGSPDVIIGG